VRKIKCGYVKHVRLMHHVYGLGTLDSSVTDWNHFLHRPAIYGTWDGRIARPSSPTKCTAGIHSESGPSKDGNGLGLSGSE
jgi:hypothetical protein